jgi:hypothetical protein
VRHARLLRFAHAPTGAGVCGLTRGASRPIAHHRCVKNAMNRMDPLSDSGSSRPVQLPFRLEKVTERAAVEGPRAHPSHDPIVLAPRAPRRRGVRFEHPERASGPGRRSARPERERACPGARCGASAVRRRSAITGRDWRWRCSATWSARCRRRSPSSAEARHFFGSFARLDRQPSVPSDQAVLRIIGSAVFGNVEIETLPSSARALLQASSGTRRLRAPAED